MKKTNILYWIFTGLFAAFMLLSGITNALVTEESVSVFTQLGYPVYLVAFMGVAKVLGAIAIILPGFPRLKEWAYAGLFFDLLGATYSLIATDGFQPPMLFMVVLFTLEALSYTYYHKRQRQLQAHQMTHRSPATA